MMRWGAVFAVLAALAPWPGRPADAEQIVVSNYGIAANGMPYAIAMQKGFFQQSGADVTGVLSSNGGGTTVRNLMEGGLAYGEVDLAGTVLAINQGAQLKIISDNVLTASEFVWAVKPDSPVKTLQDLHGQKIGYTNPRSTSQALDVLLLQSGGMTTKDAELVRVGGFGEQIVALGLGSITVATLADPVWSRNAGKLRVVVRAIDALPPLCNTIGVTTVKAAETQGAFLRAVLRGRRMAVEFMYAHPDEAAAIVADVYHLDLPVAQHAIEDLTAKSASNTPYWGTGKFDFAGMDRMIAAQKIVGALTGDVDWSKIVDQSFLPDDQRSTR
jgi:NitT/TauT family transport system substrate-binding protein